MTKEAFQGIWVFAEQEHGMIEHSVFELLAKVQELKAHCGETITAVLLGNGVETLSQTLISRGADQVLVVDEPALEDYSARTYQKVLSTLAEKYHPSTILYAATPLGRDVAPRVMVSLQTGLTADAIDLGFDEDGAFYQTTPAYGGKILAHIVISEKRPQMATVHTGLWEPLAENTAAVGEIIRERMDVSVDPDYLVLETCPVESEIQPISQAKVIVAGGRGIKSEEDLTLLETLADLLGGVLASSRPLVDMGWLSHEKQIGQSGETVKPDMIINIGISGAVQYQLGMNASKCVVTVNPETEAPIYALSRYGVAEDYRVFIPALIRELKRRNGKI